MGFHVCLHSLSTARVLKTHLVANRQAVMSLYNGIAILRAEGVTESAFDMRTLCQPDVSPGVCNNQLSSHRALRITVRESSGYTIAAVHNTYHYWIHIARQPVRRRGDSDFPVIRVRDAPLRSYFSCYPHRLGPRLIWTYLYWSVLFWIRYVTSSGGVSMVGSIWNPPGAHDIAVEHLIVPVIMILISPGLPPRWEGQNDENKAV